jgi:hypothetical protein
MCLFCVCVVLCLGRGLATSWSLVQGVLPSVKWSWNWKPEARAQGGCRASEKKNTHTLSLWRKTFLLSLSFCILWTERIFTLSWMFSPTDNFFEPEYKYRVVLSGDSISRFSDYVKVKAAPVTGRGGPQGWETSRLPHFLDNQLTDGGEVVSLMGRPLPTGRFLVLISVRGWVDLRAIVRLERLGQFKNPVTSSGLEPATFRRVA